jgi:hypothetical protein
MPPAPGQQRSQVGACGYEPLKIFIEAYALLLKHVEYLFEPPPPFIHLGPSSQIIKGRSASIVVLNK